jgi:hypothetical protein
LDLIITNRITTTLAVQIKILDIMEVKTIWDSTITIILGPKTTRTITTTTTITLGATIFILQLDLLLGIITTRETQLEGEAKVILGVGVEAEVNFLCN